MVARWASFVIGMALILAPLVLGYGAVAPILHDIAIGLLVCVATLAAFEWPLLRFALAVPGLWLLYVGQFLRWDGAASIAEVVAGGALFLLAPIPSARFHGARGAAAAAAGQ